MRWVPEKPPTARGDANDGVHPHRVLDSFGGFSWAVRPAGAKTEVQVRGLDLKPLRGALEDP